MALGCKTESQLTAFIAEFELALIIFDYVSVIFQKGPYQGPILVHIASGIRDPNTIFPK